MANYRCRPGDLAIVTKCGVPERIGLLVTVIERCTLSGHDWLTEFQSAGVAGRDITTGRIETCQFALMHDWNLTPLAREESQVAVREVAHG